MGVSVGNLSLVEKIGQMFMVGVDYDSSKEEIMELIQKYKIGGIVINGKNTGDVNKLKDFISFLKSTNLGNELPLFIAIEHEPGKANMLPSEIRRIPAIKYIADTSDKNLIYDTALITGKVLKGLGINMNFWPLLDLGGYNEGKDLGDRCISNNPVIVSSYGEQIINGLKQNGVIPVVKYFPGHGGIKQESELIIPYTRKSLSRLEQSDLVPFKSAIDNGIDAVMVGNINVARLNLFSPATLSYKVVTKLLKTRCDFKGIAITDDLLTKSVDIQYGIKSSVRHALLAGNDILMIKDIAKVRAALEDTEKQIKHANIDEREINVRVEKIINLKVKYNLKDNDEDTFDIEIINSEIEELLNRIKK